MAKSSHPDIAAALIVLGRRKGSQYCAGWFTQDDEQRVYRAAVNAGYYVLKLEQVPPGAVHWVQRGVVKPDGILTLLAIAADVCDKLAGPDDVARSKPAESAPELPFASDAGVASSPSYVPADPATRVSVWNSLKDGDVVLAAELGRKGAVEGYWPAVITHIDAGGRYTLRWRDDDRYPPFKRDQHHLGILHAEA